MANLRTAMDSAFWDLNIASPQTLHGSVRAVPGEPIPLDGARASRALRIQQLSFLSNGFPLGIIPSFAPTNSKKELGSFSLQSLLLKTVADNWWVGLIGQFRPKKLISAIKSEVYTDDWEMPAFKDIAKHFLDKSLYSIGLCAQLSPTPATSILLSTEKQGARNKHNTKAMLFHRLPEHDITLEAAWPELFVDHKGNYWDVPESISLDCSSLVSESGFRYRFGIHKNSDHPRVDDNSLNGEAPLALMPGLCAKAAFSYEKSKDLWRDEETKEDLIVETERGRFWRPSYDIRLKEPHAAFSGIIGGTCAAWFGGGKSLVAMESQENGNIIYPGAKSRNPFSADLFGSVCYTFQKGKFRKLYRDLTRVDARLDISSASALAKRASNFFKKASDNDAESQLSSPKLNLILQQQVAGPIVFRVDSKFSLDSWGKLGPHMDDVIYSLNYSLRLLQSGKVVAWYSPKRKEGMVELRLFEF